MGIRCKASAKALFGHFPIDECEENLLSVEPFPLQFVKVQPLLAEIKKNKFKNQEIF